MNRSVLSPLRASRRSGAVPTRAVLCYVGRACAATTLALLLSSLVSSPVSADEPPFTLAEAQRVALSRSKQLEASQLGVSASKALGIAAGERPDPVAKLALDRWVPGASDHALVGNPAIDAIPLHKHGLDAQLARHPEILALERREELARAGAEAARADRRPDWSVELVYSQRGIGYSNMVTLELTVPLEIRRASRQDQRLAAKLAEASQAKAERE